jgi:hypothetical protein
MSPTPNTHDGGLPLLSYPHFQIQAILSFSPYLEAVYSIRNSRKCHAAVTRTHLIAYEFSRSTILKNVDNLSDYVASDSRMYQLEYHLCTVQFGKY